MKEHRYTIADIEKYAYREGKQTSDTFMDWMDYMISMFDYDCVLDGSFPVHARMAIEEHPLFGQLTLQWLIDNTEARQRGELLDWFGQQYEEQIKSKSKADALGQFYTPMPICRLMAKCAADRLTDPQHIHANDCACGSGRTLLALEELLRSTTGYDNRRYYEAADIDPMSVRMCALNLMIAGVRGRVMCQNTLTMETFYGYEINEVRYPITTPLYSIRKLSNNR